MPRPSTGPTGIAHQTHHPLCGRATCRRLATHVVVKGAKRMARCSEDAWRLAHGGQYVILPIEAVWIKAPQYEPDLYRPEYVA